MDPSNLDVTDMLDLFDTHKGMDSPLLHPRVQPDGSGKTAGQAQNNAADTELEGKSLATTSSSGEHLTNGTSLAGVPQTAEADALGALSTEKDSDLIAATCQTDLLLNGFSHMPEPLSAPSQELVGDYSDDGRHQTMSFLRPCIGPRLVRGHMNVLGDTSLMHAC